VGRLTKEVNTAAGKATGERSAEKGDSVNARQWGTPTALEVSKSPMILSMNGRGGGARLGTTRYIKEPRPKMVAEHVREV